MDKPKVQEIAHRFSFNAFLNSFLKEWTAYSVEEKDGEAIIIVKFDDVKFRIPIEANRRLGKFQTKSFVQKIESHGICKLTFLKAAEEIVFKLSAGEPQKAERFFSRVKESFTSMNEVLETRLFDQETRATSTLDFIEAEQELILGHPFHPTPKSRKAFSKEEAQVFCPEYRNSFGLSWYLVDPEILFSQSSESFPYDRQEEDSFPDKEMLHNNSLYQNGYRLFPIHPWQERALEKKDYFKKYLKEEKVVPFHKETSGWKATSSLRTVFSQNSSYMLKFSLSLKLTNSVRHLLPKEVDRGLQLYDVVHSEKMAEFNQDYDQFQILCEPFYLCLKDEKKEPSSDSVVVFRENPFCPYEKSKNQIVLSTLTQENMTSPGNGILNLVSESIGPVDKLENIRDWFKAYLEEVLKPFLILQANYGVLLGAHQQNLVIKIERGLPKGCYFRDCQGTGYSELGFNLYSPFIKSIQKENENVVSQEMGHALFGYYLITNSSFGVISALSQLSPQFEEVLLSDLRDFIETLRAQGVKDSSFLDYLLESERLKFKGNFFCSLQNINENTSLNPLEIYTTIKNPIVPLPKEKAL